MAESAAHQPRTVVITGASRGLGRVLCERMAGLGHTMVVCGRSADAMRDLEAELGPRHDARSVDVSDSDAVSSWAAGVIDRVGVPDLVINNAGVINRRAPLWSLSAEEVARVLRVNVLGTVHVVQAFLPAMIDRGSGVVVNVSSGWGHSTAPEVAPYCASKFAIEGLTGALAQELPSGLAAVAWSPGIIRTEMLDTAFGDDAAAYPDPSSWADDSVPFLLGLGPKHNGQSLRLPGY